MGAASFYPVFRDYFPGLLFKSLWLQLFIPTEPLPLDSKLKTQAFNSYLKSPIGLSAGLDINGMNFVPLLEQGHSFIEIGPIVQSTESFNKTPYEITETSINQNCPISSTGLFPLKKYLKHFKIGPRGLNLHILQENLFTMVHLLDDDYLYLLMEFYHLADFFTVNLCSAPGKDLKLYQRPFRFRRLLEKLVNERNFEMGLIAAFESDILDFYDRKIRRLYVPIYVKIDCEWQDTEALVQTCIELGIDGIIVGDSSDDVRLSREILKKVVSQTGGKLEVISFGGLWDGREILERVKMGAKAVQVFSVLLCRGPWELKRLQDELLKALNEGKFDSIDSAFNFYSKDKND
jgi:dihydroorotate dehydrogenase